MVKCGGKIHLVEDTPTSGVKQHREGFTFLGERKKKKNSPESEENAELASPESTSPISDWISVCCCF